MFSFYSFSLVVFASAPSASASSGGTADALFQRARGAIAQKDYAQACPLFEQSHAAEPALGTLLNLADCYDKQGRAASAWLRFNEAAAWAARNKETAREAFAQKRASEIKPALQYLVLKASTFPQKAQLSIDGASPVELPSGLSIPVDPGRHHFLVTAPGFEKQERDFTFQTPGSTQAWELGFIAQPSAPAEATPSLAAAPPPPPLVVIEQSPVTSKRVPGMVTATGAVLLGAGAAGLAYCHIRYDAFRRQQPGGPDEANPSVSRSEFSTMRILYPVSWAAASAGAMVLAGGLYALFHEPGRPALGSAKVSLAPGPHGGQLFLHGEF